ncbi:MAG: hypothetical protein ACRDTJ_31290 [Pseudonocardiaceae bacterium]
MNAINHGLEHDVLAAAEEDHGSVIELTRRESRAPDLNAVHRRAGITPDPGTVETTIVVSRRRCAAAVTNDLVVLGARNNLCWKGPLRHLG